MHPQEHHVREAAYHIWESEGRPSGQEARHWEMACQLLKKSEASNEAIIGALETTPAKTRKKTTKAALEATLTQLEQEPQPAKTKATKAAAVTLTEANKIEGKPVKAAKSKKTAEPSATAASTTSIDPATQLAAETAGAEEKPKAKRSRKKNAESESA